MGGQLLDHALFIAVGVVVACVAALTMSVLPARHRLAITVLLAVPQFIIPGVYESATIFQAWVAASALVTILKDRPRFPSTYSKVLVGLAGVYLVAMLWSPLTGISLISALQVLSLLAIAVNAAVVHRDNPESMPGIFKLLSLGVCVESILVVIFRISPTTESAFLNSALAKVLIGTDKINGFFSDSPDNVMDPSKAGGLWLNANTASMFLGVAACAFVAAGLRYRRKWFYFTAVTSSFAVLFTGSKTGIILVLVMPAIGLIMPILARPRGRKWILPVLLAAYPAFLLIQSVTDKLVTDTFVANSAESLESRSIIWSTALTLFRLHPILGLGFGGWGEQFGSFSGGALGRSFPPHNILIAAWSDSGLLGAVLTVALILVVIMTHVRRMAAAASAESAAWGFSLAAFAWLWTHGMADAVTFYGDLRTMVVPALLLGALTRVPQSTGSEKAAEIKKTPRETVGALR